ncbi:helix-turn-helix transcriptional regulator [Nocardioides rotundus]|uniref:heat shock protein transcriptional repressor HspR n=1 Tax=Nocardioides rotundus TaxID=1774216 RepID=UPI001CBCCE5F|nr:helix-turn-helix transcriptional regulator [Nocardioides rotundus]UAL29307.1 helix-turn-helix transcriptional regulator [Nocardioides rotundus]
MASARRRPPVSGPDAAVYVISVAAELSGLHPQTLRSYERMGLIRPGRTSGGGRRYSERDVELLRMIADLTATGVGVEGVRRILELENQVRALQQRNTELWDDLEATREALRRTRAARRTPGGNVPAVRDDPTRSVMIRRSR